MHNVWHLLRDSNREGDHIGSRYGKRGSACDVQETTANVTTVVTIAVRRSIAAAAAQKTHFVVSEPRTARVITAMPIMGICSVIRVGVVGVAGPVIVP